MAPRSTAPLPAAAAEWFAPKVPGPVLAIGRNCLTAAERAAGTSRPVILVSKSQSAPSSSRAATLVSTSQQLPFASRSLALIVTGTEPADLAVTEFARVLAAGGLLAVMQTARDDSVPWVRRLASLLQAYDPTAMTTGQDDSWLDHLARPGSFPSVDHRTFRMWVPITKDALLQMVSSLPSLSELDPDATRGLLHSIADLYDGAAKHPEPLLLPYSVSCWRAEVAHQELEEELPTTGLQIGLWPATEQTPNR